jgi:NAD(P)-dependent dehydrogenase (short-subunit alcohol dehydrogenase family)
MDDAPAQARPVALVTGASRGVGRGVAIALGSHGCTVYVSGRSETPGEAALPGTIHETARAVTAAGGEGVAVRVDHGCDAEVEALIGRIADERGRLDILVNNACVIHDQLTDPRPFWEKPLEVCDLLGVGLRSGYVAAYYAAPLLVRQGSGLVVFVSGKGAMRYMFGPAYGAQKSATDKFAADMAVELRDFGVAVLSVWPGTVQTDRLGALAAADPEQFGEMARNAETAEFTGHVIWALRQDPELMQMTGQTVIGAEMGAKYGIVDADGRRPLSCRETLGVAPRRQPWPKRR